VTKHASCALWSFVAVTTLAICAVPERVKACSGVPPCRPAAVLPANASRVPVNMAQFFYTRTDDTSVKVGLFEPGKYAEGDTAPEVPLEYFARELGGTVKLSLAVVKPMGPLVPGSLLSFRYSDGCGSDNLTAFVMLSEAAPIPTQLGTLHADEGIGFLRTMSRLGSCVSYVNTGYADIRVELSEEARPYADQWIYQLRVDGYWQDRYDADALVSSHAHAPWDSSRGRGLERIFAACNGELDGRPELLDPRLRGMHPYLEPGRHDVEMVGVLPDGTELVTDAIQVELRCPAPADAPEPQAEPAPEPDAQSNGPPMNPSEHEAYGCAATGNAEITHWGAPLWLLAAFAWRRRWLVARRRRPSHPRL